MKSVEHLVLPRVPASPSLSPVTLNARRAVSVMMVLSSMGTSAYHQQAADAITKAAIAKEENSSGLAMNVRVCVPVMG